MKKVTILLLVFSVLVSLPVGQSETWSEVARFTGSGSETYTSDYFTCDHVEWRIRWEYVPNSQYPNLTSFSVFTYPKMEGDRKPTYVNYIMKAGTEDTSGISYIHGYQGTFYMYIDVGGAESYTIIVEQDLNSIPEFPSWIILPLIMILALAVIALKKTMKRI